MAPPSTKLCVFCRRIELISQSCPTLQHSLGAHGDHMVALLPPKPVTPLQADEEALIENLQKQPSLLCQRCLEYDTMRVFEDAEPLDGIQEVELENTDYAEYRRTISQYAMALGQLSSLLLTPSCPLCRLIFRILPREGLDPTDNTLRIVPFRSCIRESGWERLSPEFKLQTAILLGLDYPRYAIPVGNPIRPGDLNFRRGEKTGEAIGLISESTFPGRMMSNARFVEPMIDFSMPKRALDFCLQIHDTTCQADKPPELLLSRMVDVLDRVTVQCPDQCDYFALSYVWGGVMPAVGALASGTLPRTIEDAITVTKKLGRRYLWVDALCIDQTPNPTPEQAENKEKQLKMMDLIYGCASLTLVAMSGQDSNAGLPGVRPTYPRMRQVQEVIDGRVLFTVPPTITAEQEVSTWASRSWTLQEGFLSRRYLIFTETQLEFSCCRLGIPESLDFETASGHEQLNHSSEVLHNILRGVQPDDNPLHKSTSPTRADWFIIAFEAILSSYTARQMSNDEDSLTAFLGILSTWEKRLLPSGFIWGLPLQTAPQFLGWMHDRKVVPRRRTSFPSWSWAGWEGEVTVNPMLLEKVSGWRQLNPTGDMAVQFVGINRTELVVEGWEATLEIRTDPFSEAFVLGTDDLVGTVMERNFLHNNTLASGTYTCLIIERVKYRFVESGPEYQKVFMVVLDWAGQVAIRRTMVTLTTFAEGDFVHARPLKKTFRLI